MAGVYRGDHFVYVGNVGTGYGVRKVAQLMPKLKAAASETNPFGARLHPEEGRDALVEARTRCRDRVRGVTGSG